jgi:DNA-binding transcriptional regulator YiaG
MTGPELKEHVEHFAMSQNSMARWLGVDDRTMRRWIADDVPTPKAVSILLRLMRLLRLSPEIVDKMLGA